MYCSVAAGDTLSVKWTVTALDPKHGGGMVVPAGTCTSQEDIRVAEADAKLPVQNRA